MNDQAGQARASFRDRLSIVMPSADYRAPFLRQGLVHLAREGFDGDLILLDFGRERLDGMGLWTGAEPFRLRYFHNGPDMPYFQHIRVGAEAVDTPYVLFHPDDDFMFFDVIAACVALLEARPDVAVAQGKAVRFHDGEKPPRFHPYSMLPIEDASPLLRFVRLCLSYNHQMYLTQRRDAFLRKMTLGERFKDDVLFWQYYDSALSVIEGKSAVFPSLGFARRVHPQGWSEGHKASRDATVFPYILLEDDFSRKFRAFREAVLERLLEAGIQLNAEQKRLFEDACVSLVRWGLCGQRADNQDAKNLPALLQTPVEQDKLQRMLACMENA